MEGQRIHCTGVNAQCRKDLLQKAIISECECTSYLHQRPPPSFLGPEDQGFGKSVKLAGGTLLPYDNHKHTITPKANLWSDLAFYFFGKKKKPSPKQEICWNLWSRDGMGPNANEQSRELGKRSQESVQALTLSIPTWRRLPNRRKRKKQRPTRKKRQNLKMRPRRKKKKSW